MPADGAYARAGRDVNLNIAKFDLGTKIARCGRDRALIALINLDVDGSNLRLLVRSNHSRFPGRSGIHCPSFNALLDRSAMTLQKKHALRYMDGNICVKSV